MDFYALLAILFLLTGWASFSKGSPDAQLTQRPSYKKIGVWRIMIGLIIFSHSQLAQARLHAL